MQEEKGHYHPLTLVTRDLERIFREMGFTVAEGPEVESERNNFDLLNIPADHPARDMWDTFWLKTPIHADTTQINADNNSRASADHSRLFASLLRTHTSPVQVRYMESHRPPIRIIAPGKTYRYEATDATHEAQFYQIEGLMIDKGITLAHLKGALKKFFDEFFGTDSTVRFRPSYFPFVEPGVEVDASCFKCGGKGCNVCKGTGWVEIMGAGMVHPRVLLNVGIDPREYQGFAFGTGVERLAMMKYGVDDIRVFHNGDLRVVSQF